MAVAILLVVVLPTIFAIAFAVSQIREFEK